MATDKKMDKIYDPIVCRFCGCGHDVIPGTESEATLFRAFLLGATSKTYYCSLDCYLQHKAHRLGQEHKPRLAANQVAYYHDLERQPNHANWRRVPWLDNAYKNMCKNNA